MKTYVFVVMSMALILGSCSRESENYDDNSIEYEELSTVEELLDAHFIQEDIASRSTDPLYYEVPYDSICPGETVSVFAVKDWYNEPPLMVKLFSPTGKTYYIPLVRSGDFQYRLLRLQTRGRWYWRYVYALNKLSCEPEKESYIYDNSSVRYDGHIADIVWPFITDECWIKTCGDGCGAHTTENNEYYAQDWACSSGSTGKKFYSPVDGIVKRVAYAPTTYGNYIDVEQVVGEHLLRFRVAHLDSTAVFVHQVVKAGSTILGAVGSTGNSTGPHAHCSVFDDTGELVENQPFIFINPCK